MFACAVLTVGARRIRRIGVVAPVVEHKRCCCQEDQLPVRCIALPQNALKRNGKCPTHVLDGDSQSVQLHHLEGGCGDTDDADSDVSNTGTMGMLSSWIAAMNEYESPSNSSTPPTHASSIAALEPFLLDLHTTYLGARAQAFGKKLSQEKEGSLQKQMGEVDKDLARFFAFDQVTGLNAETAKQRLRDLFEVVLRAPEHMGVEDQDFRYNQGLCYIAGSLMAHTLSATIFKSSANTSRQHLLPNSFAEGLVLFFLRKYLSGTSNMGYGMLELYLGGEVAKQVLIEESTAVFQKVFSTDLLDDTSLMVFGFMQTWYLQLMGSVRVTASLSTSAKVWTSFWRSKGNGRLFLQLAAQRTVSRWRGSSGDIADALEECRQGDPGSLHLALKELLQLDHTSTLHVVDFANHCINAGTFAWLARHVFHGFVCGETV